MSTKYMLISAAIAGALAAILTNVPVINLVNCLLCGWIWIAGIFAVWLYRNQSGQSLQTGQGAILGLVTGIVAAVISTIISAIVGTGSAAAIPAESMAQLEQVFGSSAAQMITSSGTSLVVGLLISLVLYSIFGVVGGLIGAAIFKPKPGPVDV